MADMSFDEARAKIWLIEVNQEIGLVEDVLEKVEGACKSMPSDEDTLVKGFVAWGGRLNECWTTLTNGFHTAQEKIGSVISTLAAKVQELGDTIEEYKNRVQS